jgi:hypothetical protein
MRSCSIEVCHIPIEYSLELFLMEDQQMVKAFLPHTPQKAFADGIRSWRMIRCFENLNGTRCRYPGEARPKFVIIITNQILRCLPKWRGFSKLLRHPGIGGRSCHSRVDHAPRTEFDDDERLRAVERRDPSPVRSRKPRSGLRDCAGRSPTSILVAGVCEPASYTSG